MTLHYDTVRSRVATIIEDVLSVSGRSDDLRLRLVVEELVQNIADYAYEVDGPLTMDVVRNESAIVLTLCDKGKPFNPLLNQVDVSLPLDKRPEGGLGIFLVAQYASLRYEYVDQSNRLTVTYSL